MHHTTLIELIAEHTAHVMQERDTGTGACILSTRTLFDVARRFGLKASAVPVFVELHNPRAAALQAGAVKNPSKKYLSGAHTVAVGNTGIRDALGFDGHVIANIEGIYVDAEFWRYMRPSKGITYPFPFLNITDIDWEKMHRDAQTSVMAFSLPNGALLTIRSMRVVPYAQEFRRVADWQQPSEYADTVVERVLADERYVRLEVAA